MFVGSINQDLRCLVAEITKQWDVPNVYIGCSGNFTIERILKDRGFNLHGNDVSLYTSTIGHHLTKKDWVVGIKSDEWRWLEDYMQDGVSRIATLLLCTTMLDGLQRTEPFFTRRREAYRNHWDRLHRDTCERVNKGIEGLHLSDFWAGDVVEWALASSKEDAFISFPPTYKGGYEKLYVRELTNDMLAEDIKKIIGDQVVTCDSAEPKSIKELKNFGVRVIPAKKGPDSIRFGIDWLKRQKIIIDVRCQNAKKRIPAVQMERRQEWKCFASSS